MSLGKPVRNSEYVRDVEADVLNATIAEYEKFNAAGLPERAKAVAAELKKLGYDVAPKKATAKEKAVAADTTEKAVESE
jgi:hypothetical protein